MKRRLVLVLAAVMSTASVALCAGGQAASLPKLPTKISSLMDSTVQETYNYRFSRALEFADSMIALYPDRPEGYIYRCGIYSKMLNEGSFQSPDSVWKIYRVAVDRACKLSKERLEIAPDDVRALFNYAGALVYRSRYEAAKNDWLGLMSDGVKSRNLLEKAVGLDPHFYDAYSGIGAFDYYAAHLPWYLKPVALVLGISGNQEKGIHELKEAAQFGDYSKAEAASFLADIVYTDSKDYIGIVRLSLELHTKYPGNLDFVRALCFGYYKLQDYNKVVQYADPCLAHFAGADSMRFISLAYIRYYRGEAFAALRTNYNDAIADYSKTIEMGAPSVLISRAYYGRGSVYERLGNRQKAMSDFETAIRLNSDDDACREARVALDSLKTR